MQPPNLLNSADVLLIAEKCGSANRKALKLAARLTTTENVQDEVKHISAALPPLKARMLFWERVALFGGICAALSMLANCVRAALPSTMEPEDILWSVLVGFAWYATAMFMTLKPETRHEQLEARLALLEPVVGSRECETALEYIQSGYPEVLAWRDIALHDREILYRFDVEVLRALHYAARSDRSDAARKEAQVAACRELYNLPAATAA